MGGTWRTSGILTVWVQDATSIWWDTANQAALSALWRPMLPPTNLSHLPSLILLYHPIQCPLHESSWNNLSYHFPMYLYMQFPPPGSSQQLPCLTLTLLPQSVSPRLLCNAFPAEMADPLACLPPHLHTSSGTPSHSCVLLKAGVCSPLRRPNIVPGILDILDKYSLKKSTNEWLHSQIPKEESNLVSSKGASPE